jgi:hypothetical protein
VSRCLLLPRLSWRLPRQRPRARALLTHVLTGCFSHFRRILAIFLLCFYYFSRPRLLAWAWSSYNMRLLLLLVRSFSSLISFPMCTKCRKAGARRGRALRSILYTTSVPRVACRVSLLSLAFVLCSHSGCWVFVVERCCGVPCLLRKGHHFCFCFAFASSTPARLFARHCGRRVISASKQGHDLFHFLSNPRGLSCHTSTDEDLHARRATRISS